MLTCNQQKMASLGKKFKNKSKNDLLVSAISSNDLALVKKCMEQGADVNSSWPFGHHTLFTKAIEKGNIDIIRYIIRKNHEFGQGTLKSQITPLIVAIRSSFSLPTVELLVENGANVNECDISGRTPLNEAISLNKNAIVEYLLLRGAKVNQSDSSGNLPITLAVKNNRLEIVSLLMEMGANVNQSDNGGDNATTLSQRLTDASIFNYLETFSQRSWTHSYSTRILFEKKDPPNEEMGIVEEPVDISFVKLDWKDENEEKSSNDSVLEIAEKTSRNRAKDEEEEFLDDALTKTSRNRAKDEEEEFLDDALTKTSRNRAKDEEEEFLDDALTNAVLENNLEVVQNLIHYENVNKIADDGFTPLAKAIRYGKTEVVKYLLSLKADTCKTVNGKTPLLLAVEKQNLDIIQLLLEHGAQHTIQTAFSEAVNLENLEIIKLLLQNGVQLNVVYKSGHTPLVKSAQKKNLEIVKELVENGANVNMPDGNGNLPLNISLEAGDTEMVTFLINKGATIEKTQESSFLLKYIKNGDLKMIKILVELAKVDVDVLLNCGSSPLTKATELENLEMVEYLLSCNRDCVNKLDGNNKVPLSIAAKNQNLRMVKLLMESGADNTLASEEIEEYSNVCEDFALYLDIMSGKYDVWKGVKR